MAVITITSYFKTNSGLVYETLTQETMERLQSRNLGTIHMLPKPEPAPKKIIVGATHSIVNGLVYENFQIEDLLNG